MNPRPLIAALAVYAVALCVTLGLLPKLLVNA